MPLRAELIQSSGNTIIVLSKCATAVMTEAKMSLHRSASDDITRLVGRSDEHGTFQLVGHEFPMHAATA
jgi:hypothetical protein